MVDVMLVVGVLMMVGRVGQGFGGGNDVDGEGVVGIGGVGGGHIEGYLEEIEPRLILSPVAYYEIIKEETNKLRIGFSRTFRIMRKYMRNRPFFLRIYADYVQMIATMRPIDERICTNDC